MPSLAIALTLLLAAGPTPPPPPSAPSPTAAEVLARALGLEAKGAIAGAGFGEKTEDFALTEVARVEVGRAFMERQPFTVYPLDALDKVEGVPVEGLLGHELIRRFVTRIDYQGRRVTLLDAAGYRHGGRGAVLPFVFDDHIPQVDGEVDGLPGKFDLDTGSRAFLVLLAPFVKAHGLAARYGAKLERIGGWGVGGPSRELVARARRLKLGPVEIPAPVVGLATSVKGAFAMPDVAGNVGAGVLSRFTVTLDYRRQEVVLEKNAAFGRRDQADKSGLWLHMGVGGWDVIEVVPGTPAAEAGLLAGETIRAADGLKQAALPLPELRRRLRESPDGTVLTLRVGAPGQERTVRIKLRALI